MDATRYYGEKVVVHMPAPKIILANWIDVRDPGLVAQDFRWAL